jgi:hypothetical protein
MVCTGEVVRKDRTVVDQFICKEDLRGWRGAPHRGFDVIQKSVQAAAAV